MIADVTETRIAIPRAKLYCMVCGWTGDRKTVLITPDGNSLQCPICREHGKLEPPSSVADLHHMTSITSRDTIEERRRFRRSLKVDAPDWLDNMEKHIIKSKARGAEA
jgi:hypothetical protein